MAMALCKILDVPTMMAMITPVASPVAVLKSESSSIVFCAFALPNSKKKMVKSKMLRPKKPYEMYRIGGAV